jgi:hypothetical protein
MREDEVLMVHMTICQVKPGLIIHQLQPARAMDERFMAFSLPARLP